MNKIYTPNGLSISQLKKDAKKIKKELNIPLNSAQQIIVKNKTNYKSWHNMMDSLNSAGNPIARTYINNGEKIENLVVYKNKPIVLLNARPGFGKTTIGLNLISNSSKNRFLHCSICKLEKVINEEAKRATERNPLTAKLLSNISYDEYIFNNKNDCTYARMNDLIDESILGNINENHGFVFIDEFQRLLTNEKSLLNLIYKCSFLNIPIIISDQIRNLDYFSIIEKYISYIIKEDSANKFSIDKHGSKGLVMNSLIDKRKISLHIIIK
jgi:hypothetical protein